MDFNIYVFQKANIKGMLFGPKKEYTNSNVISWVKTQDMKIINCERTR